MGNGKHRVVITGMGLVTPIGHNTEDSWAAILAGQTGFATKSEQFDINEVSIDGVCEVKDFDAASYIGRKEARRRDRNQQFVAVATQEALDQSGLQITDSNREDIGIFIGTGVGGIQTTIQVEHTRQQSGPRRVSPFSVPMIMPNGAAGMAAIDYGIQGPSLAITTACAAGNDAVGYAFRQVRDGTICAALAGGTEAPLTKMTIAGFDQAGALSHRKEGTPSPFDRDRDGLVPGEGAGVILIESLESAQARGATILGELVGYGQTTDAFHITAPAEGGAGAARAIKKALEDAGVSPNEVDYINAHGTGTVLNDSSETMAIKSVLGEYAYSVPTSSTKSMTGHIMGGTGAIETVFCALTLRDQVAPPTINFENAGEDCDLDYIPNQKRTGSFNIALNNAFGFGGHNAVIVIKRFVP